MNTKPMLVGTLLAFWLASVHAEADDVEKLKNDLNALNDTYKSKLDGLAERMDALEKQNEESEQYTQQLAVEISQQANRSAANTYNPGIGLVLNGKYLTQSPSDREFAVPGFFLGEESGPGEQGFSLGESELNLSAAVDDKFYANVTVSFGESTEVEEAFLQAQALPAGFKMKFGRFLSSVGYLNSRHSHTDDFASRPLAYQVFLGNSFADDGVQLSWLAPTPIYWASGVELYRGESFPAAGAANNGQGVSTLFTHVGGDIGSSHSWRAGLSLLKADVFERSSANNELFSGDSNLLLADVVWKWAPGGNSKITSAELQAEIFKRTEKGEFFSAEGSQQAVHNNQSGWYVQGVYQFASQWRCGIRYEQLQSDSLPEFFNNSILDNLNHRPQQASLMLDWRNSEFSRVRLQFSSDQASPDNADIWIVQYTAAFGAHGAHAF